VERRIVDDDIEQRNLRLLAVLASSYLIVVGLQERPISLPAPCAARAIAGFGIEYWYSNTINIQ
jgi:hypothetical protein